tara:strand:+ start:2346 stop:4172 length:1827 start_codon:yes stop_codon:yes gene_type:complete
MTTKITGENVTDGTILNVDVNPSAIDPNNTEINNLFNIGVIGFKMAVNEGLTVFNLVDGVVDEFHSEGGVDTAENVNASYDSTSDFYSNQGTNVPLPSPQVGRTSITATGSGTYSVEPTITAVDVLVIGGGGGAGAGGYNNTGGGGGGAGGLIFYEDYPVTPGSSIPVSVGVGGRGGGGASASIAGYLGGTPGPYETAFDNATSINPAKTFNYYHPNEAPQTPHGFYYGPGEVGTDSVFNASPALVLTAEGGGAGGGYSYTNYTGPSYGTPTGFDPSHSRMLGGSGGGLASFSTEDNSESSQGEAATVSTQTTNHPVPGLSNDSIPGTPINARGAFGNDGGIASGVATNSAHANSGGGGGAGTDAGDGSSTPQTGGFGGEGLNYNIADGSTPLGYAGGGGGGGADTAPPNESVPYGGGVGQNTVTNEQTPWLQPIAALGPESGGNPVDAYGSTESYPGGDGTANRGGGGGGGMTEGVTPTGVGIGGNGGSGVIIVAESRFNISNTSMTLISDTFTASSTPTTARIVVFAELPDGLSDFTISATRDNSTFNAITLTDTGYVAGSSGTKIYTGSTPLTGTASPQVQLRWKVVGSSLSGSNKIHGVSLQWK